MKKLKKNFLIWLIIGFILSSFYNFFTRSDESRTVQKIAFSDFLKEVEKDNVLEVKDRKSGNSEKLSPEETINFVINQFSKII